MPFARVGDESLPRGASPRRGIARPRGTTATGARARGESAHRQVAGVPRRATESRSAKFQEGSDARARRARRKRRRRSAYLLACALRGQRLVHRLETPPQHAVQTRAHLLVAHNRRLAVPHQRILPAPARGLVHADGHEATHQWVRVRVILPNRHRRVGLPGADAPGPADNAREGEVTPRAPARFGTTSRRDERGRARGLAAPVSTVRKRHGASSTRQENEETFPARRKRGHSGARPAIIDAARRTSDGDGDRGDPVRPGRSPVVRRSTGEGSRAWMIRTGATVCAASP